MSVARCIAHPKSFETHRALLMMFARCGAPNLDPLCVLLDRRWLAGETLDLDLVDYVEGLSKLDQSGDGCREGLPPKLMEIT